MREGGRRDQTIGRFGTIPLVASLGTIASDVFDTDWHWHSLTLEAPRAAEFAAIQR
jgi:hypothetical protein